MKRSGCTLVELVVSLVLLGVIGGAAAGVVIASHRAVARQAALVEANATLRAGAAILAAELRALDATAPSGSDLLRIASDSLTYRAFRNLYLTCSASQPEQSITVRAALLGSRPLSPAADSLMVFVDGDPLRSDDDRWIHTGVGEIRPGAACPDGSPGLRITVGRMPDGALEQIDAGAPVRGFAVWQAKAYADAGGTWWIGMRRYNPASRRWPAVQPAVGPIATGGLRFSYYDAAGQPTQAAQHVAWIDVVIASGAVPPHRDVPEGRGVTLRLVLRNSLGSA
jgi:type II secretory pathway pseudopilin PulG